MLQVNATLFIGYRTTYYTLLIYAYDDWAGKLDA